MKRYFVNLVFLILLCMNLVGAELIDDSEANEEVIALKKSPSSEYCDAIRAIEGDTNIEGDTSSANTLTNLFNTKNLYNPTLDNSGGDVDILVNNILGALYTRKAFIKLNETQFCGVVNGCQEFFKTRFGFSLIEGWMLSRFDKAVTPYYVGKFHSYKKMFEGMIEKYDTKYPGVTNAINSVFKGAMENIQKDRWDYYFNCELWLHSAIDRVKEDYVKALSATADSLGAKKQKHKGKPKNASSPVPSPAKQKNDIKSNRVQIEKQNAAARDIKLSGMKDIIKKSFIGIKVQKEEAKEIGWPFRGNDNLYADSPEGIAEKKAASDEKEARKRIAKQTWNRRWIAGGFVVATVAVTAARYFMFNTWQQPEVIIPSEEVIIPSEVITRSSIATPKIIADVPFCLNNRDYWQFFNTSADSQNTRFFRHNGTGEYLGFYDFYIPSQSEEFSDERHEDQENLNASIKNTDIHSSEIKEATGKPHTTSPFKKCTSKDCVEELPKPFFVLLSFAKEGTYEETLDYFLATPHQDAFVKQFSKEQIENFNFIDFALPSNLVEFIKTNPLKKSTFNKNQQKILNNFKQTPLSSKQKSVLRDLENKDAESNCKKSDQDCHKLNYEESLLLEILRFIAKINDGNNWWVGIIEKNPALDRLYEAGVFPDLG